MTKLTHAAVSPQGWTLLILFSQYKLDAELHSRLPEKGKPLWKSTHGRFALSNRVKRELKPKPKLVFK